MNFWNRVVVILLVIIVSIWINFVQVIIMIIIIIKIKEYNTNKGFGYHSRQVTGEEKSFAYIYILQHLSVAVERDITPSVLGTFGVGDNDDLSLL